MPGWLQGVSVLLEHAHAVQAQPLHLQHPGEGGHAGVRRHGDGAGTRGHGDPERVVRRRVARDPGAPGEVEEGGGPRESVPDLHDGRGAIRSDGSEHRATRGVCKSHIDKMSCGDKLSFTSQMYFVFMNQLLFL